MNFYRKMSKKEKSGMYKKYLQLNKKDLALSVFFIICSTSTPVFSIKNAAIWVLVWYLVSFVLMLYSCVNQEDYNRAVKRENHYNKRHHREKERKQKWKIEIGGWNFTSIKISTATLLGIALMIVSYMHQFENYNQYMSNEKAFFSGIWFDTYIITFSVGYYNLIVEAVKNNRGIKGRLEGILNLLGKTIGKRILNIISFVIWIGALSYSFNEFSIFGNPMNYVVGFLYLIVLCIPFE